MLARSTTSTTFTRHIYQLVEYVAASSLTSTRTGNSPGTKSHTMIGYLIGDILALCFAMLYPGIALYITSCGSPGTTSLEATKAKWRARLAQSRAEGVKNFARAIVEGWFPDPCEQSIKEKALGQTMKCTLEDYDICAEGMMNYDYERELRRIGKGLRR